MNNSTRTWYSGLNSYMVIGFENWSVQRNPAMHIAYCGNVDNFEYKINILCKNKPSYPQTKLKRMAKNGGKKGILAEIVEIARKQFPLLRWAVDNLFKLIR